jgi:acetylornithine deacetylase/succinyl-diaminopimelate desuccinylase-like protein
VNPDRTRAFVDGAWDDSIVPTLVDYIRIPNKSPLFDPGWQESGHMDRAVDLIAGWCRDHPVAGMTLEVVRLEGRTPVILIDVPGDSDDTVLLYGHLDKQPEMTGWSEGLGPWEPVIRGDRLYGRGGADDGYAAFASLTALRALEEQGIPRARCVVLIEAAEESGSPDLPAYMDALSDRIGTPSLVICLDSGCGNYEQLWCTTSLRGLLIATLTVDILNEGVHSGDAGGVVPSSFRILRTLLSRLEDEQTGDIRLAECHVDIPQSRRDQAAAAAAILGGEIHGRFPFVDGAGPATTELAELILNRTWRPSLAVTGASGLPALDDAGNVLRPGTAAKLSLRLPPTADAAVAFERLRALLTTDVPYGAQVTVEGEGLVGWEAPALAAWLGDATEAASQAHFRGPAMHMGEGGSIPFMAMLGERFPEAQFLITGLLGPGSNAHGPNEFLHIPAGKRLTACVADVIAAHHGRD